MGWFGKRALPPQRETLRNDTEASLEVMVEMIPRRYVLQPGDEMVIQADAPPSNQAFNIHVYDGGLQVCAAWDIDPQVWINGSRAEPDWTSPGPNAEAPSVE
ncbi:MAG TPA: hypothetical protein VF582_03025 [Allosphingosinicella sp.]|jgi:hypothetical protein